MRKWLVFVIIIVVSVAIVLIIWMIMQFSGRDIRLVQGYLPLRETKKVAEVENLALNDCEETKFTGREEVFEQAKMEYLINLNSELENELIGFNKNGQNLIRLNFRIEGTKTCYMTILVDKNGEGLIGYKKKEGEMIVYNTVIEKTLLNDVKLGIDFYGFK